MSILLSTYELLKQKSRAQAGDIAAMKRLDRYYGIYKGDIRQAEYWTRKAADAGDPNYQEIVAAQLLEKDPNSPEGLALMKRAAANGDPYAKIILSRRLAREGKGPEQESSKSNEIESSASNRAK